MSVRALVVGLLVWWWNGPALADRAWATSIVTKAETVVQEFAADPELPRFPELLGRARAVFILPTVFEGGFIMRNAGGTGVLLIREPEDPRGRTDPSLEAATTSPPAPDRGRPTFGQTFRPPGFFRLWARSYDLDIDTEFGAAVLLVMTEYGLGRLLSGPLPVLGEDLGLAAGPRGEHGEARLTDVLAFVRLRGGEGGARFQGFRVEAADEVTTSFYGRSLTSAAIARGGGVPPVPEVEALRAALAALLPDPP